jgi:hypothetical protein
MGRVTESQTAQEHPTCVFGCPAEFSLAGGFGGVHRERSIDDQLIDGSRGRLAATQHDLTPDGLRTGNDHHRLHGRHRRDLER